MTYCLSKITLLQTNQKDECMYLIIRQILSLIQKNKEESQSKIDQTEKLIKTSKNFLSTKFTELEKSFDLMKLSMQVK